MPRFGVVQRTGGVEEVQVVLVAVVSEPEVPHPGAGEVEHRMILRVVSTMARAGDW